MNRCFFIQFYDYMVYPKNLHIETEILKGNPLLNRIIPQQA